MAKRPDLVKACGFPDEFMADLDDLFDQSLIPEIVKKRQQDLAWMLHPDKNPLPPAAELFKATKAAASELAIPAVLREGIKNSRRRANRPVHNWEVGVPAHLLRAPLKSRKEKLVEAREKREETRRSMQQVIASYCRARVCQEKTTIRKSEEGLERTAWLGFNLPPCSLLLRRQHNLAMVLAMRDTRFAQAGDMQLRADTVELVLRPDGSIVQYQIKTGRFNPKTETAPPDTPKEWIVPSGRLSYYYYREGGPQPYLGRLLGSLGADTKSFPSSWWRTLVEADKPSDDDYIKAREGYPWSDFEKLASWMSPYIMKYGKPVVAVGDWPEDSGEENPRFHAIGELVVMRLFEEKEAAQ